jgi:hypothetical protein
MLQMTYQNVSIIKNQQHRYATSKVAAKGSKTTRKNIKPVVQHQTLYVVPCTTNILNFLPFLRNNIVRRRRT